MSTATAIPYFDEPNQILCGLTVPHIFEEQAEEAHKSIVDRYYTRYYFVREDAPDEDHLVLIHSNRICLVSLAPNHVALSKPISRVDFNIGNCDRSDNRVKGKGKKGAMALQPTSALAMVHCEDGSQYKVFSCITGKLIEVNETLATGVNVSAGAWDDGYGYVAILLPKMDMMERIKTSLLTEQQYKELRSSDKVPLLVDVGGGSDTAVRVE